jgi:hypothetical protein
MNGTTRAYGDKADATLRLWFGDWWLDERVEEK